MKKNANIEHARPDLAKQWDYSTNAPLTPKDVSITSTKKFGWVCNQGHQWVQSPAKRARSTRHDCPYCSGKKVTPGKNDLISQYPYLEQEWDFDANKDLDPHTLHRSSNIRASWKCSKNHHWKTAISHRTDPDNPTGCPYCSNQKVMPGENDLLTNRPDIASSWDYEANAPLLPSEVAVGSSKRVNWICLKNPNHKWVTTVAHRTAAESTGCPYCNGHKILPGDNDLATLHPDLLLEWDYEANGDLDPRTIGAHSNRRVCWKCAQGHRWVSSINKRTRDNSGCPYDSGRRAIPGETDLLTLHPLIAKEWDSKRNGDLTPSDITPGSNKKVWWQCERNHQWQAKICNRTYLGNQCPVCTGRKPDVGKTDLGTRYPVVSKDWDYTGNNGTTPQDYCAESTFIADWQCHICGTKWQRAIWSRTRGNKCPNCHGLKVGD